MNEQEIQNTAQALLRKVETGQRSAISKMLDELVGPDRSVCDPLSNELNGLPPRERLAVAREMKRLNTEHRKTNPHLPAIESSFGGLSGREQLIDMRARQGSVVTDIYDPEKTRTNLNKGATTLQFNPTAYLETEDGKRFWGYAGGKLKSEPELVSEKIKEASMSLMWPEGGDDNQRRIGARDAEQAFKQLLKDHGDRMDDRTRAQIESRLGLACSLQGKKDEALEHYNRSLEAIKKSFGEDSMPAAMVLKEIAQIQRDRGNHSEAESKFSRALQIAEQRVGPDSFIVGMILKDYADLLEKTGRESQAQAMQARVAKVAAALQQKAELLPHGHQEREMLLDNARRLLGSDPIRQ